MGIVTSSGEPADYRYINNGLRAHNFSSLGIGASHSRVQADFTPRFAKAVQLLRHKLGYDLPVTSAYRSIEYNRSIYRARGQTPTSNSRHTHGDAIDINMQGMGEGKRAGLLAAALDAGFTSVGFYGSSDLMHLDARPTAARWGNTPEWASPVMAAKWSPKLTAYQRDYVKAYGDVETIAQQQNLQSSFLTAGDRDTLIRTVVGEAAGENDQGMEAVAHVIKNRTADKRWPRTASEVALQPSQFSAWNAQSNGGNSLARAAQPNDQAYRRAAQAVDRVFDGTSQDPTGGAVYYYAPQGMPDGAAPHWWGNAVNESNGSKTIGNHRFAGRAAMNQQGQGVSAQNPGRGAAPQTMRVSEQVPVDPKNYTMDQHEMLRKTGRAPTVTKWYEKIVPGSQVEAEHKRSLQPTTSAPRSPNDPASVQKQQPQLQSQERQQPTDIIGDISSLLASEVNAQNDMISQMVQESLSNRTRFTDILQLSTDE